MNIAAHDVGFSSLEIAAYFRPSELCRYLLSMLPSVDHQQQAIQAAGGPDADAFIRAISAIPVVEWQRQLGLQEEYLSVDRVLAMVVHLSPTHPHIQQEGDQDEDDLSPPLCVLVLREEMLRQTRLLFQLSQLNDRAIPQRSLEWHERKWRKKNP